MKRYIVLLAIAFCGCKNGSSSEGTLKDGVYLEPTVKWKIRIPEKYTMTSMKELKALEDNGRMKELEKENGEVQHDKIKNQALFQKDQYNFFNLTLFNFVYPSELDWRIEFQQTKVRNYTVMEGYGFKPDSTATRTEEINGIRFSVYEFNMPARGQQPPLHQYFYSGLVNNTDFSIAICADSDANAKEMNGSILQASALE